MFDGGNIDAHSLDNTLMLAQHSRGRCYSGAPSGLRAIRGYFQPLLPTAPPPN